MTARDLMERIPSTGLLSTAEGLSVRVDVLDARTMYGRVDLLVRPAEGDGTAWVSERRVLTP